MAWAFQKESEILSMFNYHLDEMKQTGVIDRLGQTFMGDASKPLQVQDINGLGYEHLAFPFIALLSGLCVALLQLGIETVISCKKKCSADKAQSNEDESTSEEAKEMIDDIYHLLVENHCRLGDIKFLSKMRVLSAHHEDRS